MSEPAEQGPFGDEKTEVTGAPRAVRIERVKVTMFQLAMALKRYRAVIAKGEGWEYSFARIVAADEARAAFDDVLAAVAAEGKRGV